MKVKILSRFLKRLLAQPNTSLSQLNVPKPQTNQQSLPLSLPTREIIAPLKKTIDALEELNIVMSMALNQSSSNPFQFFGKHIHTSPKFIDFFCLLLKLACSQSCSCYAIIPNRTRGSPEG